MNNIMNRLVVIAKKELNRFFKDWRMVISALIFPGVILFFLYAIVVPNVFILLNKTKSQTVLYAINPSATLNPVLNSLGMKLTIASEQETEEIKKNITEKSNSLLIVFPSDFDKRVLTYDVHIEESAPEIRVYYNSLTNGIVGEYGKLIMVLNEWESGLANRFDINKNGGGDLAKSQDQTGFLLSIMLPVFLLLFVFYGAMAVAIGTITGEKEKGTIAAVLIIPMSTKLLAAGKVLALGLETFLCGFSGFLGIFFSLQRLLGSLNTALSPIQMSDSGFSIDITYYGFYDYLFLILILLSTAYFIVTLVSIVSVFARTVREAQLLLMPVVLAVITISLLGTIYGSNGANPWYHCIIPVYNTIKIFHGIFGRNYSFFYSLLTMLSNILYSIAGIEILSRLFNNEKIMFIQ